MSLVISSSVISWMPSSSGASSGDRVPPSGVDDGA
jgi:hypothetical protein